VKFLQNLFSFFGGKKKQPARNYFISTSTQSDDRVRRLGLSLPSAEGSAVLDRSRLSIPAAALGEPAAPGVSTELGEPAAPGEPEEYKPDPYYEWVIDVDPGKDSFFTIEDVFAIFDLQWRQSFSGSSVYGFSLTNNRWTYALSGGGPERFGRLQIGVSLLDIYDGADDTGDADRSRGMVRLQNCFDSSAKKIRSYRIVGATAQVTITEPVEAAIVRSKDLLLLKQELDHDIFVVLKADNFYPGLLAWDILTETGLRWGHVDLFHWDNSPRRYGDDSFFSVWTSTAPGYFLPEAIKAGKFNPVDLVFGYWIGRSADPMGVFDVMMEVVAYCRQHLGGVLLGRDGQPFDAAAERARLQQIVDEMMLKGLPPGSNKALRIFQ
jgi:cell division protein ZipA